ncbi:MAG: hypothetical protein WC548_02350 [Candidatus Pacearchaeota archaeon]
MGIQDLIQEVKTKESYAKLQEEDPKLFFCAGFLIFDIEKNSKKTQLDFFLPEKKRISAFEHPFGEYKTFEDEIENVNEQKTQLGVDIEDLEKLTNKILEKNKVRIVPSKIIAILRDNRWNVTAMDKFLGIARIKIDAETAEVISFEKGSLMDFMGIRKN